MGKSVVADEAPGLIISELHRRLLRLEKEQDKAEEKYKLKKEERRKLEDTILSTLRSFKGEAPTRKMSDGRVYTAYEFETWSTDDPSSLTEMLIATGHSEFLGKPKCGEIKIWAAEDDGDRPKAIMDLITKRVIWKLSVKG